MTEINNHFKNKKQRKAKPKEKKNDDDYNTYYSKN